MDSVTVRAKATLVGDYGRKLAGDCFQVPERIARFLAGRNMVEFCQPTAQQLSSAARAVPSRIQAQPLVTCIMPTKDRPQFVTGAIDCFLRQTYPHKELIILDDGEPVESLIPRNPAIRYIRVAGPLRIGYKRNLCCEQASGDLIAHWDDDDWSAPTRLEEQVKALQEHPEASVTGYNSMLFMDQRSGKAYQFSYRFPGKQRDALGTSLMYRREFWMARKFTDVQIGEDGAFVRNSTLFAVPGEKRMVARIHRQTTAAKLGGPEWKLVPMSELPEMA